MHFFEVCGAIDVKLFLVWSCGGESSLCGFYNYNLKLLVFYLS